MNIHACISIWMSSKNLREFEKIGSNKDKAQRIKKAVILATGISEKDLKERNRTQDVLFARHVYFFLCHTKTGLTLREIAEPFNFDHSTVINSIKKVQHAIKTNYEPITTLLVKVKEKL